MCESCAAPGQPGAQQGLNRRGLLRAAAVGGVAATGIAGIAPAASAAVPAARAAATVRPAGRAGVSMRWLGVAGWELNIDGRILYFDPYVSRFDYTAEGGALRPDPTVVTTLLATGRLAGPPELIMVSHGHWDHLSDVPQLLGRPGWGDAVIRTMGGETQRNLLTAMGVSEQRLANFITVSGGEDLTFGPYQVQVVRSLHSQSKGYGYGYPGLRVAPPPPPTKVSELVEGGTLAYQVTVPDRIKILMFGGTNFVERELAGLRPDVVAISMTDFSSVNRYLERLLTVLGGPRYVIPVHNDDMITGYDSPKLPDTVNRAPVEQLRATISALRLSTQVIEPRHLEPINF